jgi:CPA1 family monovalent cation:H+ antiporter
VLVLTTAVVVLTLVVQGFSLSRVVDRSGLALEPEHTAREENDARAALDRAGLAHLDRLAGLETFPEAALALARQGLTTRLADTGEPGTDPHDGDTLTGAYRRLRHDVIAVQNTELLRLYDEHRISDTTRRTLQYDLDREETGLRDG